MMLGPRAELAVLLYQSLQSSAAEEAGGSKQIRQVPGEELSIFRKFSDPFSCMTKIDRIVLDRCGLHVHM